MEWEQQLIIDDQVKPGLLLECIFNDKFTNLCIFIYSLSN